MYFASKNYSPNEERVDPLISQFVNYEPIIQLPLRTSLTYEPLANRNLIRSSSKQLLELKGLAMAEHNQNLQSNEIETARSGRKTNRKYSDNNNPKINLPPTTDSDKTNNSNHLFAPSHKKSSFSRSMKTSAIEIDSQQSKNAMTTRKQNQFKPFEQHIKEKRKNYQRSLSKDNFNIRESLGTLSQQIKNTLKSTLNHQTIDQTKINKNQNYLNNMSPTPTHKSNGQADQGYTRYQKTPSFFINSQFSPLKKPKFLDSKNRKTDQQSQIYSDKQNKDFEEKAPATSRFYKQNETKQKFSFLRSSVTSSVSTKEQGLKHSCVAEPGTPQLRTSKKYDSYNYEKLKEKYEASKFKPQNPSVATSVRSPSSYDTPKSSFLNKSLGVQSNGSDRSRYSLNSNERSSFGREVTLNDFHLGSLKGEGRFGKFYPAIHKKTGLLVGIKQIKKESMRNMLDQFIQQLKIQSFIQHPNVVKLYGYFATKDNFYLIMEYMEEGSLFSFIKRSRKLHEEEASTKLKQVCSAVEYLHENEIIHRDIKPENIVMTCDVCKLCDFGWAVYTNTRRKTYCGTLDYVCPEILEGETYDSCVDIWAIGVLAYEMLVGKAPFYNISRKQTMKKIMECNFELPKQLSSMAKSFISKALNKNPEERQNMQNLIKHQFLCL